MPEPRAPHATPLTVVVPLLGKVLVGLALGFAAADFVVGQLDDKRDLRAPGILVRDEALGWTNNPGVTVDSVSINALGLRGDEIPADAPADEVRILAVGASRTYGAGVPDSNDIWSAALERNLTDEPGHFRVLNGGVNGYSAMQAARRALLLAPSIDPDIILIFLSPGAQAMLDPSIAADWAHGEDGLIPRDIADGVPTILQPAALAAHEALLHSNLYARHRDSTQNRRRPPGVRSFVLSRGDVPADAQPMLDKTKAEIDQLATMCRKHDIELRAVVMLEPSQMNEGAWQNWLRDRAAHNDGAPPIGTPRHEGVTALGAMLDELGCEAWQLTEELEIAGRDLRRFTVDDGHWSPIGHEMIAAGLAKRLRGAGLAQRLVTRRAASPRR